MDLKANDETMEMLNHFYQSASWKKHSLNLNGAEKENEEIYEFIGEHFCSVINNELPSHSQFRKDLVHLVSRNVPVAKLQKVINMSRMILSKSKKMDWNEILKRNCNDTFKPGRISQEEIEEIKSFSFWNVVLSNLQKIEQLKYLLKNNNQSIHRKRQIQHFINYLLFTLLLW